MSERTILLSQLCQRYSIDILYAFGSRANEAKEWFDGQRDAFTQSSSDVDIGVKPVPGAAFDVHSKVRLALALEDLMGVSRVDLLSLTDADPFLAANIIRGERLYARDSYLADEYELYILRRAGDLAPLERERMALILHENP
jgi:predicted nucleotidyltransferase